VDNHPNTIINGLQGTHFWFFLGCDPASGRTSMDEKFHRARIKQELPLELPHTGGTVKQQYH